MRATIGFSLVYFGFLMRGVAVQEQDLSRMLPTAKSYLRVAPEEIERARASSRPMAETFNPLQKIEMDVGSLTILEEG
jgi:hypothetical protein